MLAPSVLFFVAIARNPPTCPKYVTSVQFAPQENTRQLQVASKRPWMKIFIVSFAFLPICSVVYLRWIFFLLLPSSCSIIIIIIVFITPIVILLVTLFYLFILCYYYLFIIGNNIKTHYNKKIFILLLCYCCFADC